MKTLHFLLCALLVITILNSCDTTPPITQQYAQGYIRDFGTLTPVANTPLILVGGLFMDTTITDENGYYRFDYEPFNDLLSFRLISDQHYDLNSMVFGGSQDIDYDIVVNPKAWIKFHIKNVNPFNEMDYIDYYLGYTQALGGTVVDTFIIQEWAGNRDILLGWRVGKGGEVTHPRDTLFLPAYDTTLYEIFY